MTLNLHSIELLQVFDWTSENSRTHIMFNVTEILHAIAAGALKAELITTSVDDDFAINWLCKRDLNLKRCETLTDDEYAQPVLGVILPDGTTLLIDGSHRYFAHYMRRAETIDFTIVSYADCQPYMYLEGEPL